MVPYQFQKTTFAYERINAFVEGKCITQKEIRELVEKLCINFISLCIYTKAFSLINDLDLAQSHRHRKWEGCIRPSPQCFMEGNQPPTKLLIK